VGSELSALVNPEAELSVGEAGGKVGVGVAKGLEEGGRDGTEAGLDVLELRFAERHNESILAGMGFGG
jgi:hypothetical protein